MKKWTTLKSSYLFKTPFGNLRNDSCKLPNGNIIENYYVNEYSDWVNAVVITRDKKVVLVNQYRHAAGDFFLEVPAGKVDRGEEKTDAVKREVLEETGYASELDPILLGEFYVNPATQTNKVATYLITEAFNIKKQELDPTEQIDITLITISDMEEMIKNGKIPQLFTASAFYMFKAYSYT